MLSENCVTFAFYIHIKRYVDVVQLEVITDI